LTTAGIVAALAAVVAAGLAWRLRDRELHLRRLGRAWRQAAAQLETLQQAFHRFTPQDVVEDILRRGVSARGERREATILFADLVGFTSMSEAMEPETVVRVLNGYFQAMTTAISEHRGHVGKFIGDGILAFFGVPEPNPWQRQDGVRAALAMREALIRYNEELAREGLPALKVGIGLHVGPVVAGVIGSSELIEYTAIGDVVNTASRIEGLCRKFAADILVSDAVAAGLDERFRLEKLPPAEVKGKSEAVQVFAVKEAV
jgi:adenylate cyclase